MGKHTTFAVGISGTAGTIRTVTARSAADAAAQLGTVTYGPKAHATKAGVWTLRVEGDARMLRLKATAKPAAEVADTQPKAAQTTRKGTRKGATDRAAKARAAAPTALCGSTDTRSGKPCGRKAHMCKAHAAKPKAHTVVVKRSIPAALAQMLGDLTREERAALRDLLG